MSVNSVVEILPSPLASMREKTFLTLQGNEEISAKQGKEKKKGHVVLPIFWWCAERQGD